MLKYLIILLIPVITFCQEIDIKSNKIDKNQIANDSIALIMLINLADSLYDQESYDLYEDVYLEIEKKFNISNINISDYNRGLISYKLGQFYYDMFYNYDLDSCVLGEKAYNYVYESRSFEEAAQILVDLTMCKNLYDNKYNESINLILNHFLILDSLSDNLYDDFNDEIIWSLKNNLTVSYYNSDQFDKSKALCEQLLIETKALDTSEIWWDIEDFEIMNFINYANTLHKKNELNKSEKYNLRVIEIIDSLNQPDIYLSTKNMVQRNLANVFILRNEYEKASKLLYDVQNNESDSTNKAILFYDIAKIETKQNKHESAIKNLKNSIVYFDNSEHYMLFDAMYLLFENYLLLNDALALDFLEELIDNKINILKKNECFLTSEANLFSQSEILKLIQFHINLNNNKINTDYWFFIKNRDLSLDYNFYSQLDKFEQEKLFKLKEEQSKLYALQQKSFIENNNKVSYLKLLSDIESQYANIYKNINCSEYYDDNKIKNLLQQNEVLIDIAKVPTLNFTNLSEDNFRYYALIIEKNKSTKQIYIGSSDSLNYSYNLYKSFIQGRSENIDLNNIAYDIMFSAIDSSIDIDKEIIFFPEGVYNFINPLTLFNKSKNKYLMDYRKLSNINNLNDLKLRQNSIKNFDSITLFYNPLFNDNSPNETFNFTSKNRTIRGGQISPLPGTKIEGELIQKICERKNIKIDSYTGAEANEENFKSIKLGKIVHFATHGYYFDEDDHQIFFSVDTSEFINPYMMSGLLLARSENTLRNDFKNLENGWLTGLEIQALDFSNVELIILSACETMIGKEINGRGVFGLGHSIKKAGGKNIISSLWKVDDNATKDLMNSFYENLNNNSDINDQLQSAIFNLRETYSHPYYWGPFIYQY
jgi:CHAT domain-containing protein